MKLFCSSFCFPFIDNVVFCIIFPLSYALTFSNARHVVVFKEACYQLWQEVVQGNNGVLVEAKTLYFTDFDIEMPLFYLGV